MESLPTPTANPRFDVLICGAGPVGLLVGLGLQRMGISTCIIGMISSTACRE
jgi:2-polyprenyl-6-methoxyphenol hydroxylase-like FAD-dependent oxidoreductase